MYQLWPRKNKDRRTNEPPVALPLTSHSSWLWGGCPTNGCPFLGLFSVRLHMLCSKSLVWGLYFSHKQLLILYPTLHCVSSYIFQDRATVKRIANTTDTHNTCEIFCLKSSNFFSSSCSSSVICSISSALFLQSSTTWQIKSLVNSWIFQMDSKEVAHPNI